MAHREFFGQSIKEALTKAKDILGEDAYIVDSQETSEGIKIIATNDALMKEEITLQGNQEFYPITPQSLQTFKKEDFSLEKPIDAIKFIVDICEKQNLGFAFCEAWLEALSNDLKNDFFFLDDSLDKLLNFQPDWLKNASYENPIILVGPPGCGKTATLGKIALILKSLRMNIKVITLDEQKAGAFEQLSAYVNPMQLTVQVGYASYLKEKELAMRDNKILLIDTPGINILSQEGQEYFFKLSEKLQTPLTLVLPNDLHNTITFDIAKEFSMYNTKYLIGTRFDTSGQYGCFFSTAYHHKLVPVLYSHSPKILEPLNALCARRTLNLMMSSKE
jgi:flagellar biosynthesis GTPase FlhF